MEPSNIGSNNGMANLIIQGLIAIGTILVSILAIWGDWFRNKFAGPKLSIYLHDIQGHLTKFSDGNEVWFYHIVIKNQRKWFPAKKVRVLCPELYKKAADGSFIKEQLIVPIQLKWTPSEFSDPHQDIIDYKICDIGFIKENSNSFILTSYWYPSYYKGIVEAGESMRIKLSLEGDNFISTAPYYLEISWNGKWSKSSEEMKKHLVIKEIQS